ncbi:integrase catalytic domain-containing protein [Nephila pilipes]|uniref:Integrase catalytic domain-containing protein n=1 Tax=Nephila pilipes TaxID=299642 RepID=A0A8X6P168_NEPPI|nr:integrase catalytic domain-containing protein [Nephila pilipes]
MMRGKNSWFDQTCATFEKSKQVLANAAMLAHTTPNASLVLQPYIAEKFRIIYFDNIYNLTHIAIKSTSKLVRSHWPSKNKDYIAWVKRSIPCQRSNVHRYTSATLQKFNDFSTRSDHVHLDIIESLPSSKGFTYCLTDIDRFTRWTEVTLLHDIQATATDAFQ